MKIAIITVAIGGWYPRGLARMIQAFHQHCPDGPEVRAYCNVLPGSMSEAPYADANGRDYAAYAAKPAALWESMFDGCDVAILLDCAFYPIRHIGPLIDHITQHGYYLCKNGAWAGEWASDVCLKHMGFERDQVMRMEEASSYCVGLDFNHENSRILAEEWANLSVPRTIVGHHTNLGHEGRNIGFVSADPRVKGHRHDQTVLSILAHRLGMTDLVARPKFTAYAGSETAETVLVNQGIG